MSLDVTFSSAYASVTNFCIPVLASLTGFSLSIWAVVKYLLSLYSLSLFEFDNTFTALFENAENTTLLLSIPNCFITSPTIVVLPVPPLPFNK